LYKLLLFLNHLQFVTSHGVSQYPCAITKLANLVVLCTFELQEFIITIIMRKVVLKVILTLVAVEMVVVVGA